MTMKTALSNRALMALTPLVLLLLSGLASAQFTCTLTNKDEDSCLKSVGDDNDHCVWCTLVGFGFCVGEQQAEQMEQNLPGVSCDRYSPASDDEAPATDDGVPPSDDSLPDDFWTCLQKKNSQECLGAHCTWCDAVQHGFGLCMTGPAANSAAGSTFFKCTKPGEVVAVDVDVAIDVKNPSDTACLLAFLQDPTEEGCTLAKDQDGNACEWCSVAGMINICLTREQADMSSPLGVTCQEPTMGGMSSLLRGMMGTNSNLNKNAPRDPFDTACLLAFAQNPTEEGCEAAVDSDGNACEFCVFRDQYQLCLNEEQAMYGEQIGMDCKSARAISSSDAVMVKEEPAKGSPYDPSCALAFLQNPTKESCTSAVDSDGEPCKYCQLQGTLNMCLTHDQAEVGRGIGVDCNEELEEADHAAVKKTDLLDPSCLMAFANAQGKISPQDCAAVMDNNGAACEFCSVPGFTDSLCLTEAQAELAQKFAEGVVQCGEHATEASIIKNKENVDLPPNFLQCLHEYQEGDCNNAVAGCTWCTAQVGIGFCMADAAARALEECDFFSCDKLHNVNADQKKLLDPEAFDTADEGFFDDLLDAEVFYMVDDEFDDFYEKFPEDDDFDPEDYLDDPPIEVQ